MDWTAFDTWIVVVGFLAAAACALPGCYLVLRRMSLMGDAISHAVLPGIAIAFFVTHSRASAPMFLGAAAVGMLTAVLTQWLKQLGKVEGSAALGIVFTSLFALGLVLMELFAHQVHLDLDCVLYGAIEVTPLYTVSLLGWDVPQAAVVNGGMLLINALFIVVFYKELKISSFDPQLATTLGIHAGVMHYVLMALVAATVVAAFESVGSILVIAMLIVPGATAHLLTDRLSVMLVIALAVAGASAVLGHVGAIGLPPLLGFADTVTAGMMAVTAGAIFVAAMLAGPRYGLVSQAVTHLSLGVRVVQEDLLGLMYRLEESAGRGAAAMSAEQAQQAMELNTLQRWLVLHRLRRRGLIEQAAEGLALTEAGRGAARELVRSHRLWETYLNQYTTVRTDHLHLAAERLEHATGEALRRELERRTGGPRRDPQGKEIPRKEG